LVCGWERRLNQEDCEYKPSGREGRRGEVREGKKEGREVL
jgi:hypothetical protein